MIPVFLHGLESSSRGKKGKWFKEKFPDMLMMDFSGPLDARMDQLRNLLADRNELVLVGSSFGGMMATLYAIENVKDVAKVMLLAPALNFPEFERYRFYKTSVPATLYVGENDTVCPPDKIISVATDVFDNLTVHRVNDDHFLHGTFQSISWSSLFCEAP